MLEELWSLSAKDLAEKIRRRAVSAREATQSVLTRIEQVNPHVNALTSVLAEEALAASERADKALASGEPIGPLHGVPVTIKVNVDVAGQATTYGAEAFRDAIAEADDAVVSNLRNAGCIIVGRTNVPAFTARWFTDNALHGRTLNPWNEKVTPGGSSGGAAVAAATGMGAIAHGNDFAGSIRYPAFACGVVGLRATVGRIPVANDVVAKEDSSITVQLMAVEGPITRTVEDARLALAAMAVGDTRDPLWVPAPLDYQDEPARMRVALFKRPRNADPSVEAALDAAAKWLQDAGCDVEEAEPPYFEEAQALYLSLMLQDSERGFRPLVEELGDAAAKASFANFRHDVVNQNRDDYLDGLTRRLAIARAWSKFLAKYHVLLLPNSWERQFPIDDDIHSPERMREILAAQSPLMATALLGLPGLSVPVGLDGGLPTGVQLVADRYREDRCLNAGAIIERGARFDALSHLAKHF